MAEIGLALLLAAFWFNKKTHTGYIVFVVTMVYLLNLSISYSSFDDYIIKSVGYYVSQSFFELLVIAMLSCKPTIEGVLIMSLCFVTILVNIAGFALSTTALQMDLFINSIVWILFSAQILVFFSRGFAIVLFRSITKPSLVRSFIANFAGVDSSVIEKSK